MSGLSWAAKSLPIALTSVLCLLVVGVIGCGGTGTSTDSLSTTAVTDSTTLSTTSTEDQASPDSSSAGSSDPVADFLPVFETVARELAPLPVYGLRALPEGATLAAHWWPVTQVASPEEYSGQSQPNPWISKAEGEASSAEIVLEWKKGWLSILENVRGDVGLTPGKVVGRQGDSEAYRYQVNDGTLVQWSRDGHEYGVFGRQVDEASLVDLALSLEIVPIP